MGDKVFIFIDGIKGNCKDADHLDWIPIHNVHFQISRLIQHKIHATDEAPHSGEPSLSQITIIKETCSASPNIFKSLTQLEEHKFIIDVVHTKDDLGNSLVNSAASNLAGSGSTRYEIAAGHISDYEIEGSQGQVL